MKKILLTSIALSVTLGSAAFAQSNAGTASLDRPFAEVTRNLNDATAFDENLGEPIFREQRIRDMAGERLQDVGLPVDGTDAVNKNYVDDSTTFLVDYMADEMNRLKEDITVLHSAIERLCTQVAAQSVGYTVGGLLGGGGGGLFACPNYQVTSDDTETQFAAKLGWMDGYYDGYYGIQGDYDGLERMAGNGTMSVTPEEQAGRTRIERLDQVTSTSTYRNNYYNAYLDGRDDRRRGRPYNDGL